MYAPVGTVAILFTDVVGSTAAWERLGSAFQATLDAHDRLVRAAIAAHQGYEVKTEGDSFMVAFARAQDAAAAAAQATAALEAAGLPGADGPLRARMGVHVGPTISRPDPLTGRMDYYGPTVNRAARVAGAANPGQVLLSDEARATVALEVLDLGRHRLRGLGGVHRIWQLGGTPLGAPRLPTGRPTNLPAALDAFVGREGEIAQVEALIAEGARCVTLHGPGGAGKTRLSLQLGGRALDAGFEGVWFCDLSAARSASEVGSAVARALELPLGREPEAQLMEALRGQGRALILLDNAEQVVSPLAELVAGWLRRAPELVILVTSRIPLGIRGEHVTPVPPLPPAQALQLFTQRAHQAGDAQVVARLVARLDHLPLAIELAAARTRALSPRQILDRIDQRFRLLQLGSSDLPARHSSLRAALDWSWELLSADERGALAQLCVFEGAFSLEAAEAVLQTEGWAPDLIQRLVEHSLLSLDPAQGRTALLESVRDYARERVPEARAAAEQRHGHYYARLGQVLQPSAMVDLGGTVQGAEVLLDLPDIRAACQRALARGDADVATPTALALAPLLEQVGPLALGAELLDCVLAQPPPEPLHTAARIARATLAQRAGDGARTRDEIDHALRAAEACGIPLLRARATLVLGTWLLDQGRLPEASEALLHAVDLGRACGSVRATATALNLLGQVSRHRSLLDLAHAHLTEGLALARAIGDLRLEGSCLSSLGMLAQEREGAEAAEARLREAAAFSMRTGDLSMEAVTLGNLGNLLLDQGRVEEALASMDRTIGLLQRLGNTRYAATMEGNRANALAALGQLDQAEQTLLRALGHQRTLGRRLDVAVSLVSLGTLHARMGRWTEARRDLGEALDIGEAVRSLRVQAAALHRLARVHLAQRALDQATGALEQADPLLASAGDPFEQGIAAATQTLVRLARGQPEQAQAALHHARALAERTHAGPRSELGLALAEAEAALGAA